MVYIIYNFSWKSGYKIGNRGGISNSFSAPRYLSVVDEGATKLLQDKAISNVQPVYSIDSSITTDVIDGITEMFLTVILEGNDFIF